MPERNASLLLNNDVAPPTGVNNASIIQWYGGTLNVVLTGVFGGATIEIIYCTTFPVGGKAFLDDNVTPAIAAGSWIVLGTYTTPDDLVIDNLNPCLLAVRSSAVNSGTTRVKALIN